MVRLSGWYFGHSSAKVRVTDDPKNLAVEYYCRVSEGLIYFCQSRSLCHGLLKIHLGRNVKEYFWLETH